MILIPKRDCSFTLPFKKLERSYLKDKGLTSDEVS